MPARIVSAFAAIMGFFHLKFNKPTHEEIDQLIVDSYFKSRKSWIANGLIEKPR